MKSNEPEHESGHFPSDLFFDVSDNTRTQFIDPTSYLYDEGDGIECHNYGLFDQDECAAGELWDLSDGTQFKDGSAVSQDFISMDGLVVVDEVPLEIDDEDDPALLWLSQNDPQFKSKKTK